MHPNFDFSLPIPVASPDMTSTRKPDVVEVWGMRWCINSQSRAKAGKADYQHLFSSSVSVWENSAFPAGFSVNVLSVIIYFQCSYMLRLHI
ncbi:hypothetical protein TNCV_1706231 [Trichonephila clavipes]|nr:hypothetical protein TNCV_1706231 [Trichonephila clavipes]